MMKGLHRGALILPLLALLVLATVTPVGEGLPGPDPDPEPDPEPERAMTVVINEVAWAGTAASATDEWIELYNNTDEEIDLTGWRLKSDDGSPDILLSGEIPAHGFFLLERSDDTTISDIPADLIYRGSLDNDGEVLRLFDPEGNLIDTANGDGGLWPGGTDAHGSPPYASMERISPEAEDRDENWASNDGTQRCGLDAQGNPLNGTPKATNSVINLPPIAEFTLSPARPVVGEVVTFDGSGSHDPDGEIVRWLWEFGDEAIGEGQTASHKYEESGSFTVRLRVIDDRGAEGMAERELTVRERNEPPQAEFTFSPENPTVEDVVQFTDRSHDPDGEIVRWKWEFGDGTVSALRNPDHQYAKPGNYFVALTVTDDDGAVATATTVLIVDPINLPPVADFSYSPLEPTTQDVVQFIDQSSDPDGKIVSWWWDFGDGSTAEVQSPSHRYARSGRYTVTLTVTDDRGKTDETSQELRVRNVGPKAAFSISREVAPTGTMIKFDASESFDPDGEIVEFGWDFGDGTTGSGKIVEHAYADDGTYTVKLRVTDDEGVTASASGTVRITNRPPEAAFSFEPEGPTDADTIEFSDSSSDPDGKIVSWWWDFGDGTTSEVRNPSHHYQDDGTYTVKLTVTDDDGAEASITKEIRVENAPPVADFSFTPEQPTVAEPVRFTDLSSDPSPKGYIVSWGWDFGDGSTCPPDCGSGDGDPRTPTHRYAEPGSYTVTLTVIDNEGKIGRISKEVTVTAIVIAGPAPP